MKWKASQSLSSRAGGCREGSRGRQLLWLRETGNTADCWWKSSGNCFLVSNIGPYSVCCARKSSCLETFILLPMCNGNNKRDFTVSLVRPRNKKLDYELWSLENAALKCSFAWFFSNVKVGRRWEVWMKKANFYSCKPHHRFQFG